MVVVDLARFSAHFFFTHSDYPGSERDWGWWWGGGVARKGQSEYLKIFLSEWGLIIQLSLPSSTFFLTLII